MIELTAEVTRKPHHAECISGIFSSQTCFLAD